jgi:hypothetical protein
VQQHDERAFARLDVMETHLSELGVTLVDRATLAWLT